MICRNASLNDVKYIRVLLERYDLPASDFQDHIANFVVAEKDGVIVGVGGFEMCDNLGLLRSFAVSPIEMGCGISSKIFCLVKAKAIENGITTLYLLTTTASEYFKRFGFVVCNRVDVPNSIKETKQFRELCPCSAIVMVTNLCS